MAATAPGAWALLRIPKSCVKKYFFKLRYPVTLKGTFFGFGGAHHDKGVKVDGPRRDGVPPAAVSSMVEEAWGCRVGAIISNGFGLFESEGCESYFQAYSLAQIEDLGLLIMGKF